MWGAISGAVLGGAKEAIKLVNPGEIPNWRDSEEFVLEKYRGNSKQVSFYDGKEVATNFKGSTRPDVLRNTEAIEVKNYDLENNYSRLVDVLKKQVSDRNVNLPSNYTQRIVLDTRNRGYTNEFVQQIGKSIKRELSTIYPNIPIDFVSNNGTIISIAA